MNILVSAYTGGEGGVWLSWRLLKRGEYDVVNITVSA